MTEGKRKYRVLLTCDSTHYTSLIVEAGSEDEARDLAWDRGREDVTLVWEPGEMFSDSDALSVCEDVEDVTNALPEGPKPVYATYGELAEALRGFLKWVDSGEREFPSEELLTQACDAGKDLLSRLNPENGR